MTQLSVDQAYRQAFESYAQGSAPNAEQFCRAVLAVEPAHGGAAVLLALILTRRGEAAEADQVMQRAASGLTRSITLDFLPPASGRHHDRPHPALLALLEQGLGRYVETLDQFEVHLPALAQIPVERAADDVPYWNNPWLPPLDAMSLYAWIVAREPRRYVEIGSGNSTKFAWRAISDRRLPTILSSIDPQPRADIDELCDVVVREPLERADLSVFGTLQAGDIVFLDSSHRCFMGSDVTVFFTEVLPALSPGVLVGIHDIFLPFDYPREWVGRYYSEQYLLAAYLLGRAACMRVMLPLHLLVRHPESRAKVASLASRLPGAPKAEGASFWLEIV